MRSRLHSRPRECACTHHVVAIVLEVDGQAGLGELVAVAVGDVHGHGAAGDGPAGRLQAGDAIRNKHHRRGQAGQSQAMAGPEAGTARADMVRNRRGRCTLLAKSAAAGAWGHGRHAHTSPSWPCHRGPLGSRRAPPGRPCAPPPASGYTRCALSAQRSNHKEQHLDEGCGRGAAWKRDLTATTGAIKAKWASVLTSNRLPHATTLAKADLNRSRDTT